jgi:hypothetical protein
MTDQPEFRAWADKEHRGSLRRPKLSGKRGGHYPCPDCSGTDFKRFGLLQSHPSKKHKTSHLLNIFIRNAVFIAILNCSEGVVLVRLVHFVDHVYVCVWG